MGFFWSAMDQKKIALGRGLALYVAVFVVTAFFSFVFNRDRFHDTDVMYATTPIILLGKRWLVVY